MCTYFRSCRRSLALSIVMSEVVAAGMMTMGVLDPVEKAKRKSLKKGRQLQHGKPQQILHDVKYTSFSMNA